MFSRALGRQGLKLRWIYSQNLHFTSVRCLSGEFVKVLNTRFENPPQLESSHWQLASVSKNPNASNIDLFLNNLPQHDEDRRQTVLDLLATLRASRLTQQTLPTTHFSAIRFLLENATIQELLPVLEDRLKYGLFMDEFMAYAVLNAVHSSKEYARAQPLIQKLILLDEMEGIFVQRFAVKSCLMKLKAELFDSPPETDTKEEESGDVIKIRVKFLRNPLVIDNHLEMSKVLEKILKRPNILKSIDVFNTQLLCLLLRKNYTKLEQFLEENNRSKSEDCILYKDVHEIVMEFLKRQMEQDKLMERIDNLFPKEFINKETMEKHLDEQLLEAMQKEENELATSEKQFFPKWQQERLELCQSVLKENSDQQRKQNIHEILDDITTREQRLWYFDRKTEIDLQIFKKRVYYPKRWFGKKRKPRAIDENYVPPEIR